MLGNLPCGHTLIGGNGDTHWCRVCALEAENARLRAQLETLREASRNLLDACYTADERQELGPTVDGSLMDAVKNALSAEPSAPTLAQRCAELSQKWVEQAHYRSFGYMRPDSISDRLLRCASELAAEPEVRAALERESDMARTKSPWECSKTGTMSPKQWEYVKHNFPDEPYEGDLEREYGIYPPSGEPGPVALVTGKANATFIVRACNSFDDLLEACEAALEVMGTCLDDTPKGLLRAAIAKAKAK